MTYQNEGRELTKEEKQRLRKEKKQQKKNKEKKDEKASHEGEKKKKKEEKPVSSAAPASQSPTQPPTQKGAAETVIYIAECVVSHKEYICGICQGNALSNCLSWLLDAYKDGLVSTHE